MAAKPDLAEPNAEYAAAVVDLLNALEEWKGAGAHVSGTVLAIQRFVHAVCAQREAILREGTQGGSGEER